MKAFFTRRQIMLTFLIGCGIAYQGVPQTIKDQAYGNFGPIMQILSVTITGGLYALEKLLSRPHGGNTP